MEEGILCPICGKRFQLLYSHVVQAHKMPIEEFKKMYPSIPLMTEDVMKRMSESHSRAIKEYWSKDTEEVKRRREKIRQLGKKPKRPHIMIQCQVCGKLFETYIKDGKPARKYCSQSCYLKANRERLKKMNIENNPAKRPEVKTKISLKIRMFHQQDPTYTLRSSVTGGKVLWEKLKQNPEKYKRYIEFLREHAKKVFIETGKWKEGVLTLIEMRRNFISKSERRMNKILASLGVMYVWNAPLKTPVGTKFPDFQILMPKRVIIEVDGPLHEKKEWEERDMKKDQAYMQMGFSVLRFSAEEVEKEPEKVKQLILRALAESGIVYRSWRSKSWELENPMT